MISVHRAYILCLQKKYIFREKNPQKMLKRKGINLSKFQCYQRHQIIYHVAANMPQQIKRGDLKHRYEHFIASKMLTCTKLRNNKNIFNNLKIKDNNG